LIGLVSTEIVTWSILCKQYDQGQLHRHLLAENKSRKLDDPEVAATNCSRSENLMQKLGPEYASGIQEPANLRGTFLNYSTGAPSILRNCL
jgi:hypothetical protein